MTRTTINDLKVLGNNLYAATILGVFRASLDSLTAIDNIQFDGIKMDIYPNPFSNQTLIQTEKYLINASLKINNYLGETVKCIKNISGNQINLNRESLSEGIYYAILVENDKFLSVTKFIVISK